METLELYNKKGELCIVNKPKKKALAELSKSDQEERAPVLSEQEREDAENYNAWLARGYSEVKPEAVAAEEKPAKGGKKKVVEPEIEESDEEGAKAAPEEEAPKPKAKGKGKAKEEKKATEPEAVAAEESK